MRGGRAMGQNQPPPRGRGDRLLRLVENETYQSGGVGRETINMIKRESS